MIGQGLDDISGRQTRLLRRRRCSRRPKKAFRAAGQQRSGQTIDISISTYVDSGRRRSPVVQDKRQLSTSSRVGIVFGLLLDCSLA